MTEKTVAIKGMTCGHCEGRVNAEIMAIPGVVGVVVSADKAQACLLYTSPSPRDRQKSRMPSSA